MLTNDDGFYAEGIKVLYQTVKELGDTYIVAPDREKSACSHSITLNKSLHWTKINDYTFSISGTPSDCVQFGIFKLFNNDNDVIVLSGINKGENLGEDVAYSGTVAAAREAKMLGYNSFSFSLVDIGEGYNYEYIKDKIKPVLKKLLCISLDNKTFFNVNFPSSKEIKDIRFTFMDSRRYPGGITERTSPANKPYFLLGSYPPVWKNIPGSDYNAVSNQFVSATPIGIDATNYSCLNNIKEM